MADVAVTAAVAVVANSTEPVGAGVPDPPAAHVGPPDEFSCRNWLPELLPAKWFHTLPSQ